MTEIQETPAKNEEYLVSENKQVKVFPRNFGREVIYSNFEEVTRDNLWIILQDALSVHSVNSGDIDYLWRYYRGEQDIIYRTQDVLGTANNTIVENHAQEIVTFKTGYLLQNPIQYVPLEDGIEEEISTLNRYCSSEGKITADKHLSDWMHIAGVGYRLILPDKTAENDYAPFEIHTLDPRNTFVVYNSGVGNKPLLGCTITQVESELDNITHTVYSGYTKTHYFEFVDNVLTRYEIHLMKDIPIIEYPLNQARIGAFELVLPLLDAINKTTSDRVNGLENFIHSLLVLKNVDLQDGDMAKIRILGGISITDTSEGKKADIEYLTQKLDQGDTQTLIDYQYKTLLRIVCMPMINMSGAGSSDNGVAVELRDGYYQADTYAKGVELEWKQSEKKLLKLMLRICKSKGRLALEPYQVETRFDRWNRTNLLAKSQVLITMLSNEKIHPRLAFQASDMFIDPELAYQQSLAWYEEHKGDEGGTNDTDIRFTNDREDTRNPIRERESSRNQNRE